MKKYICIAVLCALCLHTAVAQETGVFDFSDFVVPSTSPVLSSFFTQSSEKSISTRFDYTDMNIEFHTLKAQHEGQSDTKAVQFNVFEGFKVWLVKPESSALFKIAVPLYFGTILISGDTVKDSVLKSENFWGSGLHIITDYVSLYGFVAYRSGSYYDDKKYNAAYKEVVDAWEESGHSYQPVYPAKEDYWSSNRGVLWSVIPVINTKTLPLLGAVFSMIDGYLTLESNPDEFKPSYQVKMLFRDINIGQSVFKLAAVTTSDWYNSDAKYNAYGGRVGLLVNKGNSSFVIEGGYRTFFDVVAYNPSYYEAGPYGRLWLGLLGGTMDNVNIHLLIESSSQNWPLPKIGLRISLGKPKISFYAEGFNDDRIEGGKLTINGRDVLYDEVVRKN
jgi:hypothetical protein